MRPLRDIYFQYGFPSAASFEAATAKPHKEAGNEKI
jgi:hypothetical protein